MSKHVKTDLTPPLARITLNRPPLNVLTTEMMLAIAEAVERAAETPEIRVIRIDAEGKAFSAGVDVGDHIGDALRPMMDALLRLFDALEKVPQPTVSVARGAVLGGGLELCLGTDICLAADDARLGQPEIKLGVFAPPASVLLPRLIGERRAWDMLLSGEIIPAADAERIGLVTAVFPADELEEKAAERIGRMLELSGAALRFAKRALIEARGRETSAAHRELNRLYLEELMHTADANEGLDAFVEKRKPVWKHA